MASTFQGVCDGFTHLVLSRARLGAGERGNHMRKCRVRTQRSHGWRSEGAIGGGIGQEGERTLPV